MWLWPVQPITDINLTNMKKKLMEGSVHPELLNVDYVRVFDSQSLQTLFVFCTKSKIFLTPLPNKTKIANIGGDVYINNVE